MVIYTTVVLLSYVREICLDTLLYIDSILTVSVIPFINEIIFQGKIDVYIQTP